jgi:ParB family chromosome partitioning protein
VPVIVREASPREMLALAIVENVQRTDLDPLEAAEAYSRLVEDFGLSQTEVADLVGKSRVAVSNTVRLLGLADEVKGLVSAGHLTEGHARALLAIEDPEAQLAAARRAIAGGWTVRRTEAEARRMSERAAGPRNRKRRTDRPTALDPDTAAAQRALEEALGTRVEIRRSGDGGQVVIHFYSEEELAAIYDHLAGQS